MAKSKKRGGAKKHKQRVQARNDEKVARDKRVQKIQREMLDQIMKEKESGAFDETEELSDSNGDTTEKGQSNSDNNNELEL
jgi:arsenate reductase-like glutaredoxin family protein